MRDGFLVELAAERAEQIPDLAALNRLFTAWVETVYHLRIHSETGVAPLARWEQGVPSPLPLPSAGALREAFLWSEHRTVSKTALVSLHGNSYQVDQVLVGRKVELLFDPFDLTELEVRYQGASFGAAVVFKIGRHSHPKARPETTPDTPAPTGIDYLGLLEAAHTEQLKPRINYEALLDRDDREGELR